MYGAITNPTKPNIICHGCGEKGHIIANCPKKGKGKGKSVGFQNNISNKGGKGGTPQSAVGYQGKGGYQ
eukprot:11544059-Karenia_brevis.AAC.1